MNQFKELALGYIEQYRHATISERENIVFEVAEGADLAVIEEIFNHIIKLEGRIQELYKLRDTNTPATPLEALSKIVEMMDKWDEKD